MMWYQDDPRVDYYDDEARVTAGGLFTVAVCAVAAFAVAYAFGPWGLLLAVLAEIVAWRAVVAVGDANTVIRDAQDDIRHDREANR